MARFCNCRLSYRSSPTKGNTATSVEVARCYSAIYCLEILRKLFLWNRFLRRLMFFADVLYEYFRKRFTFSRFQQQAALRTMFLSIPFDDMRRKLGHNTICTSGNSTTEERFFRIPPGRLNPSTFLSAGRQDCPAIQSLLHSFFS